MKFASMKRVSVLGLAAASVWIVGCDDASAPDKSVKQNLAASEAALAKLDPFAYREDPSAADEAMKAAAQAAGESSADPVWRASAAGTAGDLSAQIAATRRAELTRIEQSLRQELTKLRVLTQRIGLINTLNSGYSATDPSQEVARIESMIKSMQGDAQTPTWAPLSVSAGADGKVAATAGAAGAVPTLAATKQEISRLEGEIASRKEQIAKLTADRQAALGEGEKKFAEAQNAKGDQSVALFTEGAEARKRSEEIAMQIDLVQDQLGRLEADLAVARGQQEATNAAITQLQEQVSFLQDGWKATQESMSKQTQGAESVLKGSEPVTISIETAATDVQKQLKLAEAQRTKVLADLETSAKYYKQAAEAARIVGTDKRITTPAPGNKPYKDLKESVHTGRFNLSLAGVQRTIGTVSADKAALALEIERVSADLRKELAAANLAVPSDLPSISMDEIKSSLEAATEKLNESNDTLVNVNSGDTPKPVISASLRSRLITLHRLITLEQLKQKVNATTNTGALETLNADAAQVRQELTSQSIAIPPIPGPLGPSARSSAAPTTPSTPETPETPTTPDATDVEPATPPADRPFGGFN